MVAQPGAFYILDNTKYVRKIALNTKDTSISHLAYLPQEETDVKEMITLKQSHYNCPKGFKAGHHLATYCSKDLEVLEFDYDDWAFISLKGPGK